MYAPQQPWAQPQYPGYPVPVAQPVTAPNQPYGAPVVQNAFYTPDVSAEPLFAASQAPAINAASYIMLDANTGATLVSRNADTRRAVASTGESATIGTAGRSRAARRPVVPEAV